MFCTACAFHHPEPFGRCPVCGSALQPTESLQRQRSSADGQSGLRRGLDRFLAVATTLAVLAAAIVIAATIRQRNEDQAAAYARGMDAVAEGEWMAALAAFDDAGDHGDAVALRQRVVEELRAYESAYLDGSTALAAGRYDDAIVALLPVARDVPDYKDVLVLLDDARSARVRDLLYRADDAVAGGDWLTAERTLEEVLTEESDNIDVMARLAAIRREHAPLVLTRDHRLYVVGPDLADERLVTNETTAAWPVWNPDRTRIAFVSPDSSTPATVRRLFVVDADGVNLRELAAGVRPYSWPVWSPDGTRIAYTAESNGGSGTGNAWTVNVVDVETGVVVDLTTGKLPNATSPTWSPNGDRLAFVKRRTLGASTSTGDGPLGTTADVASEMYLYSFASDRLERVGRDVPEPWRIAWSPVDDKLLIFSRADGTSYTRGSIYLLDLGSEFVTPIDTTTQDVSPAVWSPDGSRLAYVKGGRTVRIVGLNGDDVEADTTERLSRFLTWSPGGDAVLASAESPSGSSQLISIDGSVTSRAPVSLHYDTDGMHSGPPQWSSLNPASPPRTPSYSGTANDPGTTAQSSR